MTFEDQVEKLSLLAANAMLNPMIEMKLEGSLSEAFNRIYFPARPRRYRVYSSIGRAAGFQP